MTHTSFIMCPSSCSLSFLLLLFWLIRTVSQQRRWQRQQQRYRHHTQTQHPQALGMALTLSQRITRGDGSIFSFSHTVRHTHSHKIFDIKPIARERTHTFIQRYVHSLIVGGLPENVEKTAARKIICENEMENTRREKIHNLKWFVF